MSVDQILIQCGCGCGEVLAQADRPAHISETIFLQAWKDDAAEGGHLCRCPQCGCDYRTVDDGNPVSGGGSVTTQDESVPRADSISAGVFGGTAGGTAVTLEGHGFDTDAPIVKFDGEAGTGLSVVNDAQLTVNTPAGVIKMVLAESPDVPFTVGETLTGQTSAATAVVQSAVPLKIDTIVGTFSAGEIVLGGTSGETGELHATTPLDGFVDVTIENSNGQHAAALLYFGTPTGEFQDGETVTGGTSGATAAIIKARGGHLHVENVSGQFTSEETLTGGASGATAVFRCLARSTLANGFEYTA